MFSCIPHRTDAVKQTIAGVEVAIGLPSVFSKRKAKNVELSNSFEGRDETAKEI